jgi:hypothetical protein
MRQALADNAALTILERQTTRAKTKGQAVGVKDDTDKWVDDLSKPTGERRNEATDAFRFRIGGLHGSDVLSSCWQYTADEPQQPAALAPHAVRCDLWCGLASLWPLAATSSGNLPYRADIYHTDCAQRNRTGGVPVTTNSYLEYFQTLLGWVVNNGLWNAISASGLFTLPLLIKLLALWLQARSQGADEGNKAALS